MNKLVGDMLQKPPMVSAVKIGGVPLYKKARKGQTVEREPRLIHLYEFRLLDYNDGRADFYLRCTKGTYVRTICADMGETLGCGAHLEKLRRIQSGSINIKEAMVMDEVMGMSKEQLLEKIIPINKLF
jgi:tRNA pseudouridine55 synthase